MIVDNELSVSSLAPKMCHLFDVAGRKILAIERTWKASSGAPVFTARGKYTSRGWTEWTQGFQIGSALLQFDATGEKRFLELGRRNTVERMGSHVSHRGVHDHGFNNISTYGNLLRLMQEGKIPEIAWERHFYELALKVSGAVQASRWTRTAAGGGFIYSFNGPHSLFVDTIRSLRSLAVAHRLGHALHSENDNKVSLLERLVQHAMATAEFAVYYGRGRDAYDVAGRTAHESIFNTNDGQWRCPATQQGYSPFSTWTRGLAWAICGFAEQLEYLATVPAGDFFALGGRGGVMRPLLEAATTTANHYIETSCTDGVPYWDVGAPNLHRLGAHRSLPADPFNRWEPVDSSAAAIAAQGLWRLGNYLGGRGKARQGKRYRQAALTIARTLVAEPYLAESPRHQGLLLHSVYHRPRGWDYVAPEQRVPNGESSMWGDYHLLELGLLLLRESRRDPYLTFFNVTDDA